MSQWHTNGVDPRNYGGMPYQPGMPHPGVYQRQGFDPRLVKLRANDKIGVWCGIAGWVLIALLICVGFFLYLASLDGKNSELAILAFYVPFVWGGGLLFHLNLVGGLCGLVGYGSSITQRQKSWCRWGVILNAAPWVIAVVGYMLLQVYTATRIG